MMIMPQGSKHISMIMPKELETNRSWVIMERPRSEDDDSDESNSDASSSSSSSLDLMEDASSNGNGPLYELSELMSHLPIKRGLSQYYQGKSESFTSLASVHKFEDLAKKVRKNKSCGDINKCSYSPKATIAKKALRLRGSLLSSSVLSRKSVLYKRAFDL